MGNKREQVDLIGVVLAVLVLSFLALNLHAQEAVLTTPAPTIQKFNLNLGLTYGTTLHESDRERNGDVSILIAPSYKVNDQLKLGASALVTQQTLGLKESSLSNAKLSLSVAPQALNTDLKLAGVLSASLPTNEQSREKESFGGSIGADPRLVFSLERFNIPVSLTAGVGFSRNFHELTHNNNFRPNIKYNVKSMGAISWSISERFSADASFEYVTAYTYRGVERYRFGISQEIVFQVNEKLGLSLGHSNGGNALESNLKDSNIALFDERASTIYMGVSHVY